MHTSALNTPAGTDRLLKQKGLVAKKRYGQNFLADQSILHAIVTGAHITPEDSVLEIGPGLGTLTAQLCAAAGHVTAVEIDRDLIPVLEDNLSDYPNKTILNADFMETEPSALLTGDGPFKVVANLPYYITTPVLMKLLESDVSFESITVMVQKEVADRLTARPGGKDYGALTLAVQYHSAAEVLVQVPASCFVPAPNVDSAVVKLNMLKAPAVRPADVIHMKQLIKAAFSQRRKTLVNAVSADPQLAVDKTGLRTALNCLGLDENIRGECLSLDDYSALSDLLSREDRQ